MADHTVAWAIFFDVDPALGQRRFWSGDGDLLYAGETWQGMHGIMAISPAANELGAPSRRLTLSLGVSDEVFRREVLRDPGPVEVEILWLYRATEASAASGESIYTWEAAPRKFRGRLSGPVLSRGIYSCEIETLAGDVDHGQTLYWSHESHTAEFPEDMTFEFLRDLAGGLDTRWPP